MNRINCRVETRWKFFISLLLLFSFSTAECGVTIQKNNSPRKAEIKDEYQINNGMRDFTVGYSSKTGKNGEFKPAGNFSGLWIRSPEAPGNWYWKGEGFLALYLNGKNVLTTSQPDFLIVSQGKKGIIDAIWDTELAGITVRMLFKENADSIFFEIQIRPKVEITSQEIRLFNVTPRDSQNNGYKFIETPNRKIEAPDSNQAIHLENRENWLFYYNTKDKEFGPSAILWNKKEIAEAQLGPRYYNVLKANPKIEKLHFVLYFFRQSVNWENSLSIFKSSVERLESDLEKEDFQPTKKVLIKEG